MKKRALQYRIIGLSILLLLGGCSSLTTLFFYPQKIWISTPEDFNLDYQDIWLTSADGTALHGWWITAADNPSQTMVLYLHGNAENISSHSRSMYWLVQQGVDVFALDYRGFGASEGQAMLPSVLQDVEAALAWLRQHYPQKKLVVVAQSIGTALAIPVVAQAQSHYQIEALLLDAPFTGYGAVARSALSHNVIGWLLWPWTVLLPSRWDPIDSVEQLNLPVMVLHSREDKVVPYALGKKLFSRIQQHNPQSCWQESRGAHIMSFAYAELRAAAYDFITSQSCVNTLPERHLSL